jgi:hypothetical protein
MTNTCPFCGAPKNESYCKDDLAYLYEEVYECGYDGNRPEERQPKDCMVRQIAALKERLEAWRATKVGWDEYWEELNEPEQQRLKDLDEI